MASDASKRLQTPLIDDNGDGIGHPSPLPNGGDGSIALSTYIGYSKPTQIIGIPPKIEKVSPKQQTTIGTDVHIWCKVTDDVGVSSVIAMVFPPGFKSFEHADWSKFKQVYLTDLDGDGNYTGTFQATCLGDNVVVMFVHDREGNMVAKETIVSVFERKLHKIQLNEQTFNIITESNSNVTNLSLDVGGKMLTFYVEGSNGTLGFCNLTIPKSLMSGPWQIEIDGKPLTTFIHYENSTHSFIHIEYTHTLHQINIVATWIIPEFQSHLLLLGFLILSTITFASVKRRTKRKIS
ncbi:MAG: hypothetical protein QXI91_00065 [Candidatus Bathyarchaeia archaeon]